MFELLTYKRSGLDWCNVLEMLFNRLLIPPPTEACHFTSLCCKGSIIYNGLLYIVTVQLSVYTAHSCVSILWNDMYLSIYIIRVRAAACQCLVQLAPNLDPRQDRVLSLAKYHSSSLFLHLHSSVRQLSLASIGDTMEKHSPKPPLGLEHLIWFLVGKIR